MQQIAIIWRQLPWSWIESNHIVFVGLLCQQRWINSTWWCKSAVWACCGLLSTEWRRILGSWPYFFFTASIFIWARSALFVMMKRHANSTGSFNREADVSSKAENGWVCGILKCWRRKVQRKNCIDRFDLIPMCMLETKDKGPALIKVPPLHFDFIDGFW